MTRSARAFGAVSALAWAFFAVTACSKREPPPPGETQVVPAAPAASATAAPARSPEASTAPSAPKGLSTEEDFEDESAAKVTPDTLDAQLDALEKEIQAE